MKHDRRSYSDVAASLAGLYSTEFGARERGRYRISMKHFRGLLGRARVYREDIDAVARELYELGYVLVDLESFFVVLSQKTFASYRRINPRCLESQGLSMARPKRRPGIDAGPTRPVEPEPESNPTADL